MRLAVFAKMMKCARLFLPRWRLLRCLCTALFCFDVCSRTQPRSLSRSVTEPQSTAGVTRTPNPTPTDANLRRRLRLASVGVGLGEGG